MRFFSISSILFIAAIGVLASPVIGRQTAQSVACILTDLSTTVKPLANQLFYATPENATEETLTPIIGEINTAMTAAVSNLQLLQGQPSSVIMASADGVTLGSDTIAFLVADVVSLIFKAAFAVLKVADSAIQSLVHDLLSELGKVVCSLLAIVLSLVDGLLGPLLALLAPVLAIITDLGLGSLLGPIIGGLV